MLLDIEGETGEIVAKERYDGLLAGSVTKGWFGCVYIVKVMLTAYPEKDAYSRNHVMWDPIEI